MLSKLLADLSVKFSVNGMEAVKAATDSVSAGLGAVQEKLNGMGKGMDVVARGMTFGLSGLTSNLLAYTQAGIAGSAMGERFNFLTGQISREIASLFLPQIQAAAEWMQKLFDAMSRLSGEQQQQIAHWLEAGVATLGVAKIMPVLTQGITGAVGTVRTLTTTLVEFMSGTGIGGLLPILGLLVSAFTALGAGSLVAEGGFGKLFEALEPLIEALAQVGATFAAALQSLAPIAEQVFTAVGNLVLSLGDDFGKLMDAMLPVVAAIAEILVPVIDGLAATIEFLSGFVDENAVKWTLAVASFMGVINIIPKVVSAINTVISTIKALTTAEILRQALSGPAGWIQLAAGVAVAAGALAAYGIAAEQASEKMAKANTPDLKGPKEGSPHASLAPRLSGFEAPEAAYFRIAEASRSVGMPKKTDEQQLEKQEQMEQHLAKIRDKLLAARPGVRG